MRKAAFKNVDEYIAAQPVSTQTAMQQVRSAIRQAVPQAQELISYNMPAYKLGGETFILFAAWKTHYSLYVATKPIVAKFKRELRDCKIEKGTIGFALSAPVPDKLIGRIARFRAANV